MAKPACGDRLDLVDAAYARPGGPAARELQVLCRHCPINHTCLDSAMRSHEWGVWGGTSPNTRTKRGAPRG